MSTRAQLVVEGNEAVKIYKHCDGYPEGVIPTLADLLPRLRRGGPGQPGLMREAGPNPGRGRMK